MITPMQPIVAQYPDALYSINFMKNDVGQFFASIEGFFLTKKWRSHCKIQSLLLFLSLVYFM